MCMSDGSSSICKAPFMLRFLEHILACGRSQRLPNPVPRLVSDLALVCLLAHTSCQYRGSNAGGGRDFPYPCRPAVERTESAVRGAFTF